MVSLNDVVLILLLLVLPWAYLALLCWYLWAQVREERVAWMMVVQTLVTFVVIAGLNVYLATMVAEDMFDGALPGFLRAIYQGDMIDLAVVYGHPLILWTLAVSLTAFNILESTQRPHLAESSGDAVIIMLWTIALPFVAWGLFLLAGSMGMDGM